MTAPLFQRYVAQIIDAAVSAFFFLASFVVFEKAGVDNENVRIYSLLVALSYYLFCDSLPRGRSVGKMFFNISVVDSKTGKYCSILQSFLRNTLCLVLGVLDAIFILRKDRRRLGDLLASTIAVKLKV
ncbi:hypothetical protein RN22_07955 [Grimontia sp. AD028]|nr:hypothetical protein RN22_07955 [Grimontia sp. AD028]